MSDLESQLGAIMNDPAMMEKIMSMAQSLTGTDKVEPKSEPRPEPRSEPMPQLDIGMIQKLSGLASQSGIDKNQQTLLTALTPYLSGQRIDKLQKAMRAAKMAKLASGFINPSGR